MDTPKPANLRLQAWMTAEQAAAHLWLPSRKALYQAVRRGQIPVHRFGKRLRFSRAELDHALLPRSLVTAISFSAIGAGDARLPKEKNHGRQ